MFHTAGRQGFTLIELMVVIGIVAILLAIIVPVCKSLRENNQASRCQAQLSHIGQALRLYYLDEGGVPVVAIHDDGSGENEVVDDPINWPGLEALWRLEYLRNRMIFHCPRHVYDSEGEQITRDSREYFQSYTERDPEAKVGDTGLRGYKYMPYRFADEATYPDHYRRQLTTATVSVTIGSEVYLTTSRSPYLPPDDTIVTWCDKHAESYSIGGSGQYPVLFWDGSVRLMDEELFTDDSVEPTEAWQVRPSDGNR